MPIIYLIILTYWFYYFCILERTQEPFTSKTSYKQELKKLNDELQELNTKYVSIHSQVMSNYTFECPEEPTTKPSKKQERTDDDEWEDIERNLSKSILQEQDISEKKIKRKKGKPLLKKTQRLDYDRIEKELLDSSVDDGLKDISFVTQKIKEQKN